MFERYTERARRVIFFARYEASQFGSTTIETEHLLLGLLREEKNLISRFYPEALHSLRGEIEKRISKKEPVSTSIDLPLTNEGKRILSYSAEEAERLGTRHIGTEHMLLGILREEKCVAAQILMELGLKLDAVSQDLAKNPMPTETVGAMHVAPPWTLAHDNPVLPTGGVVRDSETAMMVAKAIWAPMFGAQTIAAQSPLQAELKFNVWIVSGKVAPENALFAFILQADGRILSVGRGTSNG